METNQKPSEKPAMTSASAKAMADKQEELLQKIYEQTQKTQTFIKWQLYITIVLIVLPLLAMVVLLPMVMKSLGSLGSIYTGGLQ